MIISEHPRPSRALWVLVGVLVFLFWGFESGRILWTGSHVSLPVYQVPPGGPTGEPPPKALNLQAVFPRVPELGRPAVVSIVTTHIQQVRTGGPEFYFGDPFEEFFQQYFSGPGEAPGSQQPRMQRRRPRPQEFNMEAVLSDLVIDA